MKHTLYILSAIISVATVYATDIRITTDDIDLLLTTSPNGRLYQTYLGKKLLTVENLPWQQSTGSDNSGGEKGWEVYPSRGTDNLFDDALVIEHNDGNLSTRLYYQSHTQRDSETIITLKDDAYPVEVKLHYVTYPHENIITCWSEIIHHEKKPIYLSTYASNMLYLKDNHYYLTQFNSDWAKEAQMSTQELLPGKKTISSKLGTRVTMYEEPFFEVGIGTPPSEDEGTVLMGTIGWTGNFQESFEIDNAGVLRITTSINPCNSRYTLQSNTPFVTPQCIFTLSFEGVGQGSRNFHNWSRRYAVKEGMGSRLTLLNNWESTGFDFDQQRLTEVIHEAKDLDVDMFLLDDGWFGNKYPRNNDGAGLGDWDVNRSKLPDGLQGLVQTATTDGLRFGLWVEPEMVNPKSELYTKHPDWVLQQPNRTPYYYRHQLVLDLPNPAVQEYVYNTIATILTTNPQIRYLKWDCNSPITNNYSPYLGKRQGNLYVDYVRGLYTIWDRINTQFPDVYIMLCAGGGGRCDYKALSSCTEFWPSDNTDPLDRLYIQWGFSQFMPSKVMCAHITSWNSSASLKFRTDVAMMGKLGYDLNYGSLSPTDKQFCQQAVQNWKVWQPIVLDGQQYRLVSPYTSNHMAVNYVSSDSTQALLFAYDLFPRFRENIQSVKFKGLIPTASYRVTEENLMPNTSSQLPFHGKTFSGDYLMKVGLDVCTDNRMHSTVLYLRRD